jgi:hypothetical protein
MLINSFESLILSIINVLHPNLFNPHPPAYTDCSPIFFSSSAFLSFLYKVKVSRSNEPIFSSYFYISPRNIWKFIQSINQPYHY